MNHTVQTLSVFFPAYYDEENINRLVPQTVKVLESLNLQDYEIIIIEDGSPDNTGQVADQLAQQYDKVRVIHHQKNLGYGATLKDGFNSARFDWIFYTDGDCQFDIQELRKLIALVPYSDMIIGFRQSKQYSFFRKMTSWTYNMLIRLLFDLRVADINCAFKLMPRQLFDRFTITSQHGFIDAEVLLEAKRQGYQITQIGITHLPRTKGIATAARPTVIFNTILETLHFWFRHRT